MYRPEITVTMPAFNRADLIGRAVDSVRAQTMSDWELVIIDDGSSDATYDIACDYAAIDSRIRVYKNAQNSGIAATRNHALSRSTGRFITPLDSDDWYHPQRLERMLAAADLHRADLLADDLLLVRDGDDDSWARLSQVCNEVLSAPLFIDLRVLFTRLGFENAGITLGLTKPLVRREFLLDHGISYDTSLQVVEDYWLLADCVIAGAKFVMIPEAYYFYWQHSNNSTLKANGSQDLASTRRRLMRFVESAHSPLHAAAHEVALVHIDRLERLEAYSTFVDSMRLKQLSRAAAQVARHPGVLTEAGRNVPHMVRRRYRRYVRGDRFAFDPISGRANLKVSQLPGDSMVGADRQATSITTS